jgi:hypothetical protein
LAANEFGGHAVTAVAANGQNNNNQNGSGMVKAANFCLAIDDFLAFKGRLAVEFGPGDYGYIGDSVAG